MGEIMQHASTFFLPSIPSDSCPCLTYALVILNQPLPRFTPLLWKHAQLRVCADGGANRIFDQMPQLCPHEDPLDVRTRYKPDVIKGDMDSIRPEVQEFYTKLGTDIVDESYDQDTTDLHKCVAYVQGFTPNLDKSNLSILVTGALGGRFDHEIGNINVLHRFSNVRIVLLSDDCLIQLLPKTHHHEIHIQSSEGPHCGLIPIGKPSASTTSTGLQWDLSVVSSMHSIMKRFLWNGTDERRKISLVNWDQVYLASESRRLSIRTFSPANKALLGKCIWGMASGKGGFW